VAERIVHEGLVVDFEGEKWLVTRDANARVVLSLVAAQDEIRQLPPDWKVEPWDQ
jgi:hypothetical protein